MERMRDIEEVERLTPGHKCWFCKRPMLAAKVHMSIEDRARSATIDHVIPRSMGGSNEDENKIICCARCNGAKSSIPYAVFKVFADMVLIPYPELPLPVLRNALSRYLMHLLERACTDKKVMRQASTITLLQLKESIDAFETGRKVKRR